MSVFISVSNLGTTGFFSHAAIACGKHFEVTAFHYKVSAAIQTGFHKGGCNKSWLLRLYLCKLMGTTFCKLCISFAASCNFSAGSMRKPRTYPPLWKKKEQQWYFFLKQNSSDNIPTLKAQQQKSKLRSSDVFFLLTYLSCAVMGWLKRNFCTLKAFLPRRGGGHQLPWGLSIWTTFQRSFGSIQWNITNSKCNWNNLGNVSNENIHFYIISIATAKFILHILNSMTALKIMISKTT